MKDKSRKPEAPAPSPVPTLIEPFRLSHQKVTLDIDPSSGGLRGVTEIAFDLPYTSPTAANPLPSRLQLHLRQATIHEVYCNDILVPSFTYTDPYVNIHPRIPRTATFAQRMADLRKQHQDALISSYNPDVGELSIPLPDKVLQDLTGQMDGPLVSSQDVKDYPPVEVKEEIEDHEGGKVCLGSWVLIPLFLLHITHFSSLSPIGTGGIQKIHWGGPYG